MFYSVQSLTWWLLRKNSVFWSRWVDLDPVDSFRWSFSTSSSGDVSSVTSEQLKALVVFVRNTGAILTVC